MIHHYLIHGKRMVSEILTHHLDDVLPARRRVLLKVFLGYAIWSKVVVIIKFNARALHYPKIRAHLATFDGGICEDFLQVFLLLYFGAQ